MKKLSILLTIIMLLFAYSAQAQEEITYNPIKVIWDQNPESDLAGYLLYYGPRGGPYTGEIDIPVSSLEDAAFPSYSLFPAPASYPIETVMVLIMKAYDKAKNLSEYSNETGLIYFDTDAPTNPKTVITVGGTKITTPAKLKSNGVVVVKTMIKGIE